MSDFKPTERTVVTESRTFLVDKHSKAPLIRANQSAYLGLNELQVLDVNVTNTEHFTARVKKHLTIVSPEPVQLTLTSTGPVVHTDIPSAGYEDATIIANDFIIGEDLVITVVDDTPLQAITVVILNLDTGETENITLIRQDNAFIGRIPTSLAGSWNSFDGILSPSNGQKISLMYVDNRSATGTPKQIRAQVKAISPYTDATVYVTPMVRHGNPIGIVVEDRDLGEDVGEVTITYNVHGVETQLTLLRSDRPYGTVFVGSIETSSLLFEPDDEVNFSYTDLVDANGFPKTIEARSLIVPQVNTDAEIDIPDFCGFGSYFIRLRDFDIAGSTVQLIARNERTNKYVVVACNETAVGSGDFVGELWLSEQAVVDQLQVQVDDTIRLTYVDQNNSSGTSALVEQRKPFCAAPVVIEEPVEEGPIFIPGTIDMQVDGLFTLYGSFVGTITIKALSPTAVRCNVIVA